MHMARLLLALLPATADKTPQAFAPGPQRARIAVIAHRRGNATRPLRAVHVVTLAESIATLGLLEPLIVDDTGHILAGAHRLAALELLAIAAPMERRRHFLRSCACADDAEPTDELARLADRAAQLSYDGFRRHHKDGKVPIHVMAIPADKATSLPLAIEAAENAIRRQYTAEEVQALAVRLKSAGYTSRNGRPRTGEKTVVDAMQAIIGKSPAQVRRLLKADAKPSGPTWQRTVESFARAAIRVQRMAGDAPRDADSAAALAAAQAIIATPIGQQIWARQRSGKT